MTLPPQQKAFLRATLILVIFVGLALIMVGLNFAYNGSLFGLIIAFVGAFMLMFGFVRGLRI